MTVRRESKGPSVAQITAALKDLDGVEGRAGWFESARYDDSKATSVAYVATIHEFGTDKIPARPFMRPAVEEHGREWLDQMTQGAQAVIAGRMTARQVLEAVAMGAAGDIAAMIPKIPGPPLSPETVERKGFDTLLVDTGQMTQSITGVAEVSS